MQAIQAHQPRSHTIIEAHPQVYAKMLADGWDKKPGVRILFGRWQDVIDAVGRRCLCRRLCRGGGLVQ